MKTVLLPYLIFSMAMFGIVTAYITRYETVLWKKVSLLVMCMNLLPYTSTDYKLLHLFIPLFLFINHQKEDKWDLVYIVLF